MISIDDAQALLDEIAEGLPPVFFNELNGGIMLLPEVKLHPEGIGDDLFILGEYVIDAMGRYIAIYFGSFERVFGHASDDEVKKELRETLLHEFTHHLESLGGLRDLEVEDELFMEDYKSRRGDI